MVRALTDLPVKPQWALPQMFKIARGIYTFNLSMPVDEFIMFQGTTLYSFQADQNFSIKI